MAWLEITIDTVPGKIDSVVTSLTAAGFADLVIEDQEEFETFLEQNREYWDYIDEELQDKLQGLSHIKVYLEDTDTASLDRLKARVEQLLQLQQADFGSKGTGEETDIFRQISQMIADILAQDLCLTVKDLTVNGHDLMDLGFPAGPHLGTCLAWLLTQVQEDALPNEKNALLTAAQVWAARK